MCTVPLFAILCGFEPDDTPGVGTLYDFQHRLWLAAKIARRHKRCKKLPATAAGALSGFA